MRVAVARFVRDVGAGATTRSDSRTRVHRDAPGLVLCALYQSRRGLRQEGISGPHVRQCLGREGLGDGAAHAFYAIGRQPKGWPKGKQWVDPATSVNFRAFRRTCATWFHETAGTKNTQALLRHTTPMTTLGVYVQELPESVRTAVEVLDQKLCGFVSAQPESGVQ